MIENGHPQFEPEQPEPSRGRETFLAILLLVVIGGPFALLLYFATFGFLGYVFLIALALAAFGLLHYFLWGRSFSRDIETERRRLEEEEQQANDWRSAAKPPWERRF